MSKKDSASNKTQKTVASSSKTTTTTSSYQYSLASSAKTFTTTPNYSYKLTNDYKSKSITASNTGSVVRPPKSSTSTIEVRPSYTPVYSSARKSFTISPRDDSILNKNSSSIPKPIVKSTPNKDQRLCYTFPEKKSIGKQSNTVIPPTSTASSLNISSISKLKPIKRPTALRQSVCVDKPATKITLSSDAKRGYALILNHYKYVNESLRTREGTQLDVTALQLVFDFYRIETHVKSDLTLNQIKSEVNILKRKDFSKYDCFIIVILTHGDRNEILYASDKPYNVIDEIENPMLIENESLLNKPKIFVIQACRGDVKMPAIETDSVTEITRRNSTAGKLNIFKCKATYEGCISFRFTKYGTVFIQTFCKKLKEIGKTASIYDVMTKVIEEVCNDQEIVQVPTIESFMTKSFCFGQLLK